MPSTSSDVDTRQTIPNAAAPAREAPPPTGDLLISLSPLQPKALEATLANLASAFPAYETAGDILVATPDHTQASVAAPLRLLPYTPTGTALLLTAADYLNAFKMAEEHHARACILLGPESQTLNPACVRDLAAAVLGSPAADLVLPRYRLGPNNGLVNSAILYPVTRALYRQ